MPLNGLIETFKITETTNFDLDNSFVSALYTLQFGAVYISWSNTVCICVCVRLDVNQRGINVTDAYRNL